jgi:ketosteroid isomerase-like protein
MERFSMKPLVYVFALLLLTTVSALGVQNTTADQRVSGTPIIGETIRFPSKRTGEERMEDRQITALNQMMRAVNAGDAKSYASLYAQDAVITIFGGGEIKGRDAIEQYEVELLREFPGARLAFYSVWKKGIHAVVHYGVNGRTPGGQAMGHEGLLFYRFHPSGLIGEEHRYLDSLTPMAQMGVFGATPARALPTLPTELKVYVARGSSDEEKNVAIVRASLAALDSKNELSFLATIAEDAVLDELIDEEPFIGKRNVKAWFSKWTRAVPDAATEITTILGVGEFVLVKTVVRGTLKGQLGRLVASNKPFAVHRAAIVHVKDGKLARVSAFMNGKEIAEAVGQWPPPMK